MALHRTPRIERCRENIDRLERELFPEWFAVGDSDYIQMFSSSYKYKHDIEQIGLYGS